MNTRTLVLSQVFPPAVGGSGRWLWELYRRLKTRDVTIVAETSEDAAEFDLRSPLPIVRASLGMDDCGGLWPSGRRRYRVVSQRVAEAVDSHGSEELHCARLVPEGWVALKLRKRLKTPYICFVHGEEIEYYRSSRELSWMATRVLKSARRIIVNSENTRRRLLSAWGGAARRVSVLHPGVEADAFRPEPKDAALQERLGWLGRKVILTVGRLQRRKGHDMLIAALPRLRETSPDVLYAIVGAGEEEDRLRRIAKEKGVEDLVRFHGELPDGDLVSCYQNCDLFALPNRTDRGDFEGFGIVLLEAQACGKPVLAGKSGGTAETLDAGETGVLVDCGSPEPLAEALIPLLGDPERLAAMGAAARRWIVERFDWPLLAAKAEQILAVNGSSVDA